MKCKNCGASLLDTDQFCDQCGWKVIKERRCPECNAPLREGTKFCPKCGRMISAAGKSDEGKVYMRDAETTDIPIGDIEQNILFETEREIHKSEAGKKANRAARTSKEGRENRAAKTDRMPGEKAVQTIEREAHKKKAYPAPEQKKRERPAPVRKRLYEEWEDEEEEDDDDDEDEGFSFMTIVSVFMAFVILAVAVFLIFSLRQNRSDRDYEETEQESTVGEEDTQGEGSIGGETGNETENGSGNQIEIGETDGIQAVGTLSVTTDVNVRDNPSTEGTNVIKVAKEGETYEYKGTTQDGSWYEIILEDGSTGYVSGKFVSVQ